MNNTTFYRSKQRNPRITLTIPTRWYDTKTKKNSWAFTLPSPTSHFWIVMIHDREEKGIRTLPSSGISCFLFMYFDFRISHTYEFIEFDQIQIWRLEFKVNYLSIGFLFLWIEGFYFVQLRLKHRNRMIIWSIIVLTSNK